MAPASAYLTAGTAGATDLNLPKPIGRKPITTQEKIQAAAYKRAMTAKPEVFSPPADTTTTTPKKTAKPKTIPPPGEAFQEPSPKEKAKTKGLNSKRRKPITTDEKIQAAEVKKSVAAGMRKIKKADAKRAAREECGQGSGEKEKKRKDEQKGKKEECGKEKEQVKGREKKAEAQQYQPSALSVLTMGTAPTATKFEDRKGKGVLMRPTERAKADKRTVDMRELAKRSSSGRVENVKIGKVEKKVELPFRLMGLPEEVRSRIWRLAVVHTPFCVWPGQAKGREQPDLCMSGREVRDEVLPVFYSRNFFGIDITPFGQPGAEATDVWMNEPGELDAEDKKAGELEKAKAAVKCQAWTEERRGLDSVSKQVMGNSELGGQVAANIPVGVEGVKPWALALESSGHLSRIQHWVFSSSPELPLSNDNSLASRIAQIDTANSFTVYLELWREEGVWRANVEVHREACCVLPGQAEFGRCVVQNSPDWLNRTVALLLQRAERRGVTADMILGLGKLLRAKAPELVEVRCTGVGKSGVGEVPARSIW